MKREKILWLLTSCLILLPTLLVFALDGWLSDLLIRHWGSEGAAASSLSLLRTLRFFPLILLFFHGVCLAVTKWDNRKRGQSPKVMGLVFWILPFLSLYCSAMFVASAFGMDLSASLWSGILMGVLMLLIGNYLPKCKPNRTIGLRFVWTLRSAENWQKTHRFGGKLFVAVGILSLLSVFLPGETGFTLQMVLIIAAVLASVLYSFAYDRKQRREGTITEEDTFVKPKSKREHKFTVGILVVTLGFCLVLCFTGDITCRIEEQSVSVTATYDRGVTISLDEIISVEYREEGVDGRRVNGFGSPRLLLGWFSNDDFGNYRRYTYTDVTPCLVLTLKNGSIVVIGAASKSETEQLYQDLNTALSAKSN